MTFYGSVFWNLARRFLCQYNSRRLSLSSVVAVAGIAFGVCAFLVVVTLLHSFQHRLKSLVFAVNPNLVALWYDAGSEEAVEEALSVHLATERLQQNRFLYTESILVAGQRTAAVSIRTLDGHSSFFNTVAPLMTPSTARQYFAPRVPNTLESRFENPPPAAGTAVVLGAQLAKSLQVSVGDTLFLLHSDNQNPGLNYVPLMVVGLVHVGISQYDKQLAFLSYDDGYGLFAHSSALHGFEVSLKHPEQAARLAHDLTPHMPDDAVLIPWQNVNRDLFAQIERDSTSILFLVLVVSFVSTFNIVVTLSLTVQEKSKQIALMRSLGARQIHIVALFFMSSLFLDLLGTAFGVGLGLAVLKVLAGLGIGDLKNFYYLERIPVTFDPLLVVVTCAVALVFTLLGAIYPAWRAARVPPLWGLRSL